MSDQASANLKVLLWGTYDLSKPRTRIMRTGLIEAGAQVIEIHSDVWSRFQDKSQMSKWALVAVLFKMLFIYPVLMFRYLRAPAHDVVVVPYLGQFDVLVIWLFARLRRKPVVWDMFISLYDTIVHDRQMAGERSLIAKLLWALEWVGCRAVTRVLLDTPAHAAYVAELFHLSADHVAAIPVGAELAAFPRQPARQVSTAPTKILFYGQLIPLHGIETILEAALSERGRHHQWHIIGKGQQSGDVDTMLSGQDTDHIQREDWVAYSDLIAAIGQSDICLGIFGSSRKAGSVVPNKVYQCLSAGRTVITRESPAMTEAFRDAGDGLILVHHSDAEALLDAIDGARAKQFPVVSPEKLSFMSPREIGESMCQSVLRKIVEET